MPYRRTSFVAVFFFAALLVPQSPTRAQTARPADTTFRVGLKSINIPAPSSGLVETGSDYRVIAEPFAPVNNRLVAAFLLPEELKALQTAKTSFSRYALVEVPRRAEFADVTPELFKEVVDGMAPQFGASLDATVKDQQEEINRKLKALSMDSTTVTFDKPVMLGSFFSKPDAYGFGAIMPIGVNGKTTKIVMVLSVLRVQDRVLFTYFYAPYTDESSVTSARTVSEKWADNILAANK
jgi:hypothetical protein